MLPSVVSPALESIASRLASLEATVHESLTSTSWSSGHRAHLDGGATSAEVLSDFPVAPYQPVAGGGSSVSNRDVSVQTTPPPVMLGGGMKRGRYSTDNGEQAAGCPACRRPVLGAHVYCQSCKLPFHSGCIADNYCRGCAGHAPRRPAPPRLTDSDEGPRNARRLENPASVLAPPATVVPVVHQRESVSRTISSIDVSSAPVVVAPPEPVHAGRATNPAVPRGRKSGRRSDSDAASSQVLASPGRTSGRRSGGTHEVPATPAPPVPAEKVVGRKTSRAGDKGWTDGTRTSYRGRRSGNSSPDHGGKAAQTSRKTARKPQRTSGSDAPPRNQQRTVDPPLRRKRDRRHTSETNTDAPPRAAPRNERPQRVRTALHPCASCETNVVDTARTCLECKKFVCRGCYQTTHRCKRCHEAYGQRNGHGCTTCGARGRKLTNGACEECWAKLAPPEMPVVPDELQEQLVTTDAQPNQDASTGEEVPVVVEFPEAAAVEVEVPVVVERAEPLIIPADEHDTYVNWVPGADMTSTQLASAMTDGLHFSSHRKTDVVAIDPVYCQGRDAFLRALGAVAPNGFTGVCFVPLHMPRPDHFVTVFWMGGARPSKLSVSDSMNPPHSGLAEAVGTLVSYFDHPPTIEWLHTGLRIADTGHGSTCGYCCLNDFLHLLHRLPLSRRIAVPIEALHDRISFRAALLRFPPEGEKPIRVSRRPASRRFRSDPDAIDDADTEAGGPAAGFRQSSFRLRRAPMTQEVLHQFSSPQVQDLLRMQNFHLPTERAVLYGLSLAQRKRQVYLLHDVLDLMLTPQFSPHRHLDYELSMVTALRMIAETRRWSATTILSSAATLQGCLARIDQYCKDVQRTDWKLTAANSTWKDAMHYWQKEAYKHIPVVTEVTLAEVRAMMPHLSPSAQVLLMVTWLHAARAGNACTLRKEHLALTPDPHGHQWSITWTAAKTCGRVGPYTTHSALPSEWLPTYRAYVDPLRPSDDLFPPMIRDATMTELGNSLRVYHKTADVRCVRRGALCAMAQKEVDIDTLLVFSGHSTVAMLLRYLRRGKAVSARAKKGASAARSALF